MSGTVRRPQPGTPAGSERRPRPGTPAGWRAWWDGLSDPERFRIYTRLTSEVALGGVAVTMAFSVRGPWQSLALLVVALAAVLALESQPELSGRPVTPRRRWARRLGAALLIAVSVINTVIVRTTDEDSRIDDARTVGIITLLVAAMALVTFLRHRWWIAVGLGVLAGLAYGDWPAGVVTTALPAAALSVFMVAVTLLTLWGLQVVEDLEHARSVEAELQVTQERLRFARDLHDVVGRGFSAVAVKSELAATLSRAGDTGRATAEMDEVKALAVESMEQMRTLVRGYRDISLASEVAGARSLLSAAGCRLSVEGEADRVPQEFHEVAAWVVREGTTNIVKHTSASQATLALGPEGMTLTNDDAGDVGPARSGHIGLAERLDAVGATMSTAVEDDRYVLQVRWESP
ncbi:sensor histidine kinase [Aeromicrobium sp. CTD01-1L150]|uniref:sensor histidine kinase n=1 Tax=Aeromicrobium sp. CTD01-1L150 TaxID=3341830 RepID=UPI0035BEBEBF